MRTLARRFRGVGGKAISLMFFTAASHRDFPVRVLQTLTSGVLTTLVASFPLFFKTSSLNPVPSLQLSRLFPLIWLLHLACIVYSLHTTVFSWLTPSFQSGSIGLWNLYLDSFGHHMQTLGSVTWLYDATRCRAGCVKPNERS